MRVAWILPGGGVHGAWQASLIERYLKEHPDERPDTIVGVSAGALNGSVLAQYSDPSEGVAHLLKIWRGITHWSQVLKIDFRTLLVPFSTYSWLPERLKDMIPRGIFSSSPLLELIKRNILIDKLIKSPVRLAVGAVDIVSGEYKTFTPEGLGSKFHEAILGSASIPIIFRPVDLPSFGLLVDGGVSRRVPFEDEIAESHDKVVIFCASSLSSVARSGREKHFGLPEVASRTLDVALESYWGETSLATGHRNVMFVCRKHHHELSSVSFSKENIKALLNDLSLNQDEYVELRQKLDGSFVPRAEFLR